MQLNFLACDLFTKCQVLFAFIFFEEVSYKECVQINVNLSCIDKQGVGGSPWKRDSRPIDCISVLLPPFTL